MFNDGRSAAGAEITSSRKRRQTRVSILVEDPDRLCSCASNPSYLHAILSSADGLFRDDKCPDSRVFSLRHELLLPAHVHAQYHYPVLVER